MVTGHGPGWELESPGAGPPSLPVVRPPCGPGCQCGGQPEAVSAALGAAGAFPFGSTLSGLILVHRKDSDLVLAELVPQWSESLRSTARWAENYDNSA